MADLTASDTIAAPATPPGRGALAVVRVSGPATGRVLDAVFLQAGAPAPAPSTMPARRAVLGRIVDAGGSTVDQVVAVRYKAPASYTGEDMVEISCHGGATVVGMVLERLLAAGARMARPGEFTERAFLNGKLDLTQAEAVMDLIGAQTALAARSAAEQLEGGLGARILALRNQILDTLAHVEAHVDFPDEDIAPQSGAALDAALAATLKGIDALLDTSHRGRILREGARLVIAGPPNAGKSSLLNLMLGRDRAIVNERPGTTRDSIEEILDIGGYPVRLVDTAGLRESDDDIERDGIERTRYRLATADLVIELFDASQPPPDIGRMFPASEAAEAAPQPALVVLNKSDLPEDPAWAAHQAAMRISCRLPSGLDALEAAILEALPPVLPQGSSGAVAINTRHRQSLALAAASCREARAGLGDNLPPELVAVPLHDALARLGDIVGNTDTEDLLGAIFSTFCIGK